MRKISLYYTVDIPSDLMEYMTDDEAFSHAVNEVRERQRKYHIPANWILREINHKNSTVKIRYDYMGE
jgi:Asp-tRNA(Asn)/Glu-tRNA(Gln) amidotransferase B subunit